MITPLTLDVAHWATWDRGHLKLNVPGVTAIRGRNITDRGNPNYVGKSSFFNSMYALNFGDHQLATKKRSLKSITREQTRIRAVYDVDGRRVVPDMNGTSLALTVNGDPVKSRVKNADRDELLRVLRMTPELWACTVHVNGIASNPLVRGQSKTRCEFLERAFDLDRWADDYSRIGDNVAQFKRVRVDLDTARADLARIPRRGDPRALKRDLAAAREKLERARAQLQKVGEELAVARALPPRPPGTAREHERVVHQLEERLSRARIIEDAHVRYHEAVERGDALRRELATLSRDDDDRVDAEKLRRRIDELTARIDDAQRARSAAPATRAWLKFARTFAHRYGLHYHSEDDLLSNCRAWRDGSLVDATRCPTCGGRLKHAIRADHVEQLAELTARVPRGPLVTSAPDDATMDRMLRARDAMTVTLDRARDGERARGRRAEIAAELRGISVPRRPDRDAESEASLRERLEKRRNTLHACRQWERIDYMPRRVDELEREVAHLSDAVNGTTDLASRLDGELRDAERDEAERTRLRDRVETLEAELAMQPVYRALQMAYSPTGMRLWLLSELLEAVIDGLNEVAKTHRDPIEYGYRLARNRDLSITASNLKGTFDVRLLSGAEGNLFCLTLLAALLPLLPSHKRCNLLILDELDANCSTQTRDVIARDYLPRLTQVCNSVIMITPYTQREYHIPGVTREVLVEKREGTSYMAERATHRSPN